MNLVSMKNPAAPRHILSVGTNILLNTLFSITITQSVFLYTPIQKTAST
jgi:hypothetical protein